MNDIHEGVSTASDNIADRLCRVQPALGTSFVPRIQTQLPLWLYREQMALKSNLGTPYPTEFLGEFSYMASPCPHTCRLEIQIPMTGGHGNFNPVRLKIHSTVPWPGWKPNCSPWIQSLKISQNLPLNTLEYIFFRRRPEKCDSSITETLPFPFFKNWNHHPCVPLQHCPSPPFEIEDMSALTAP